MTHKPTHPKTTLPGGNRVFTREESIAAFGEHPWAGWKPTPSRRWPPSAEDLADEQRLREMRESGEWDPSKGPPPR